MENLHIWKDSLYYTPPNKIGGKYTGFNLSVCLSVRPSADGMISGV